MNRWNIVIYIRWEKRKKERKKTKYYLACTNINYYNIDILIVIKVVISLCKKKVYINKSTV